MELERAQYEAGVCRAVIEALARGDQDAVTRLLPAAQLALHKRVKHRYTESFRRLAMRRIALLGAAAVSRAFGVPVRTLEAWCRKDGVASSGLFKPTRRRRRRGKSWASQNPEYVAMLESARKPDPA